MNEQTVAEKKNTNPSPPRGARAAKKKFRRYTRDEKLRAVRLRLEEKFSLEDVCAETGVTQSALSRWLRLYKEQGEAGLQSEAPGSRKPKVPAPVTDKILELKQANPTFGITRISQLLRRCFFLQASPETVHRCSSNATMARPLITMPSMNSWAVLESSP